MKKLVLDRHLYKVAAVKRAAEAFEGLAAIEITVADKEHIDVKVKPLDEEVAAVVVDEFLNYALVETISDRG